MLDIQSPHNPRVKSAAKLRTSRGRQQQGRILIEGARELCCALAAGVILHEVFFDDLSLQQPDAQRAWDLLDDNVERLRVGGSRIWEKLSVRAEGAHLVATAQPPDVSLDTLRLKPQPLLLVLEGIEKPGNLGALFRTADGVGVDAVLLADPVCDVFNPNAIRASLGAIFTTPCAVGDHTQVRKVLEQHGVRLVAAKVDAKVDIWDVDLTGGAAIVMGSEALGLTDAWRDCEGAKLPMRGTVDSLNVSAAAAAILHEAARQRRPSVSDS